MYFIDFNKKKVKSAILLILILVVNFYAFAFVIDELKTNTSKIIDETNELNDFENNLKSSGVSPLFDGMYIQHSLTDYKIDTYSSIVSYSFNSGSIFDVLWTLTFGTDAWQINSSTREISGTPFFFYDNTHTPFWIFPDVSIGETVLISSIWDGDHTFEVSDELIYDLPGFGLIEVLVLQDLAYDNCTAWYEKSTGILLNGTFYYDGGFNYLIFDFINTNVFPGFYDDFENGLGKWEEITGLWHLTSNYSAWPDPYHSPTHSIWFGDESTGTYETGLREYGELISAPFSLIGFDKAILEFYHWREGEGGGYDESFVYISTDGINWDLLYETDDIYIQPWEKVSLDISKYTGNATVQLRFYFDTYDSVNNDYRGWLVDDIAIYDLSHELSVSLEVPSNIELYKTYNINATVTNLGANDESNVDLLLYLNDVMVDSITISNLPVNANETINYMWTPTQYGTYNFTLYAPPVPNEEYIENNIESQLREIIQVAIFRNNLAWYMNTTELILNTYGIDYTVFDSSYMGSVSLAQYEKVIIESDQDQLFYDTLGTYISWFENYAANGGILEIHAFDHGWHFGVWDGLYLMPGGFDYDLDTSEFVSINLTSHPILLDPHIITDEELDDWHPSTVGYFTTFPTSSKEVLLESSTLNPVFIELDYGEGSILITMQPLEWAYDHNYSQFLENVVLFDPDAIIVTAPDSSSEWEIDTSHYIYWESSGTISNVTLELYKDDVFVMEIISSTPNDGEYLWTIPSGLDDSTLYQIKIADITKLSTYAFSDYFEIFNPAITVITPENASSWETDTSESINWTSRGTIANVKIELYKDDVFVMEIISSTPNDGEYLWTIPATLDDSTQYQIKISDVSNPLVYDYSDYFEITIPEDFTLLIIILSVVGAAAIAVIITIIILKKRRSK